MLDLLAVLLGFSQISELLHSLGDGDFSIDALVGAGSFHNFYGWWGELFHVLGLLEKLLDLFYFLLHLLLSL
jgi:hypothetical protein